MKLYDYCPGNGTRYQVFAVRLIDPGQADILCISPGGWLIGIVNNRDARSYAFQSSGYLDIGYVDSHLFNNDSWEDAKAVTQLLGQIMQRPIKDPWKQCKTCGVPIDPRQDEKGVCVTCEYRAKRG